MVEQSKAAEVASLLDGLQREKKNGAVIPDGSSIYLCLFVKRLMII